LVLEDTCRQIIRMNGWPTLFTGWRVICAYTSSVSGSAWSKNTNSCHVRYEAVTQTWHDTFTCAGVRLRHMSDTRHTFNSKFQCYIGVTIEQSINKVFRNLLQKNSLLKKSHVCEKSAPTCSATLWSMQINLDGRLG
jgi:hypothetical protein